MKKILTALIASLIAIGLTACGGGSGGGTTTPLTVSIETTGTMQEGETITLTANTNQPVVVYEWSGATSGNTQSVAETFAEGTYIVSVAVTDADGKTATADTTITVVDTPRTIVEEYFNTDNLKVGDSVYWDNTVNGYVKTEQDCQYGYNAQGEIDEITFVASDLKLHHTIAHDPKYGQVIIVCSQDNIEYQLDDGYEKFDDFSVFKVCTPEDNYQCTQPGEYIDGRIWSDASGTGDPNYIGYSTVIYSR